MEYVAGRNNLACTIFVPFDCDNNCPFCTSKWMGLSGNQKIKQIRTKKIDVYDKDNNFIGTFNGAKELTKISLEKFGVNFTYVGIMDVCCNRCKSHRGYIFKYTNNDNN